MNYSIFEYNVFASCNFLATDSNKMVMEMSSGLLTKKEIGKYLLGI